MCGIAGCFEAVQEKNVQKMMQTIQHRGPDGSGVERYANAVMGHVRLAILDPAAGQQPMKAQNLSISYNGEIYNHLALRARYLKGHSFSTTTDTETILALYRKMGPGMVALLDGMFSIAILDGKSLFLARDPLGIKPLYLGRAGNTIYFASEIKALTQFTHDVQEFPPGYCYHSRTGWEQFYQVPAIPPDESITEERALEKITTILQDSVHKRLLSDVALGVSLSGGLDSSIVTLLARDGLQDMDTFCVGTEDSQDRQAAQEVADVLGTHHYEYVYTEKEILEALPEVIYYLESFDPGLVRSAIANYFLARLAAEHVKVMLTGEGADELYAGYEYLSTKARAEDLQQEMREITMGLHNINLQRCDRMSMAFGLEARVPFLDVRSISFALSLPARWKLHAPNTPSKVLLRKAFRDKLPADIIDRPKQKFSSGAGSAEMISQRADREISDSYFTKENARLQKDWEYSLPSKEALYYYQILHHYYPDEVIFPTMGRSRCI